MRLALKEAESAYQKKEVPIGAVVVENQQVIGRGHNLVETLQDPTAHAEIIAIGAAANAKQSWRLNGVTLYVTIEPCTMCIGAITLARLNQLVFGASDESMGACGSVIDISAMEKINRTVKVISGILQEECGFLMKSFFNELRKKEPLSPPGISLN